MVVETTCTNLVNLSVIVRIASCPLLVVGRPVMKSTDTDHQGILGTAKGRNKP